MVEEAELARGPPKRNSPIASNMANNATYSRRGSGGSSNLAPESGRLRSFEGNAKGSRGSQGEGQSRGGPRVRSDKREKRDKLKSTEVELDDLRRWGDNFNKLHSNLTITYTNDYNDHGGFPDAHRKRSNVEYDEMAPDGRGHSKKGDRKGTPGSRMEASMHFMQMDRSDRFSDQVADYRGMDPHPMPAAAAAGST
eukprot:CAMPEP_0117748074 /NCGR_PEP_ID=MMETSP0947-20121206/8865_1 /TAXON_ID=44440 /ORGANISM="Chattonella subsalsa, Strain CCMP2191" /LENGTH=195 /DNA_ID=CAMNT_0005565599 /DNA_START=1 /DNA_END=585 /DNA_ORIENTATION=-